MTDAPLPASLQGGGGRGLAPHGRPAHPDAERLGTATVRLLDRLAGSIADTTRPRGRELAAGLAALSIFPLMLLLAPTVYAERQFADVFLALDAGWRFMNGQVPHADYFSPAGLLYAALHGWAMQLFGVSAKAVVYANLILLPIVVAAGLIATGAGRLALWPRLWTLAAVVVTTVSPRLADGSFQDAVHMASYERHGLVLAAIIMIVTLVPPAQRAPVRGAVEATMVAALLVALFHMEATCFLWAAFGLSMAILTGSANRRVALAGATAAAVALITTGALSDYTGLYISDVLHAKAALASNEVSFASEPRTGTAMAEFGIGVLAVCAGAIWLLRGARDDRERAAAAGTVIRVLGITLSALALGALSIQSHAFGLIVPLILLLSATLVRARNRATRPAARPAVGFAALLLLGTSPDLLPDAAAVPYHLAAPLTAKTATATTAQASPLRDLALAEVYLADREDYRTPLSLVASGEASAEAYNALAMGFRGGDIQVLLDDGHALLARHARGAKVLSLSFAPWLSFSTPPPIGASPWLRFGLTHGQGSPLDTSRLLRDADAVMVPQVREEDDERLLYERIAENLQADFILIARTPLWALWMRPAAQASGQETK